MKEKVLIAIMMLTGLGAVGQAKTWYINSSLKDCTGVGPMQCMQYKEQPDEDWKFLYQPIEGFTYEAGFLYKLKVRAAKVANPPADGSSVRYTLKKVLSKERDSSMTSERKLPTTAQIITHILVEDKLEEISGKAWEFTLNEGKLFTKICNRMSGGFTQSTEGSIQFGPLMSTKMLCPDMKHESALSQAFKIIDGYYYDGIRLNFTASDKVVLVVSELVR